MSRSAGLHLRDCLDALADNAFVRRPAPQDPANPEFAYLLQAVEYVEGRDWEGDLALLADVLDELADAEGLFSVGYAYHVLFEDEEAAAGCLWRALAHKPDFPQAWNNLGTALKAEGQREEAIECYARALQLRSDYLYARYNLGITYAQIGRHKDAVRCLRLVVGRGYPHDDEAWLALAQSLGHLGQYEEALEAFNRALETRPNYPEALHKKGVMLDEGGRPDEAVQAFEAALKVRPRFAAAWHGKGVTYTGQQDHKKAAAAYRRAVRLDPNRADAWNNLSASLFALEDYDAALITAEKAIATGHAEASAWYHKGRALTWLGRHEEAVDALDEAMRRGFDEPLAWAARGVALQARGWFHEGARWLCRARRAEWLWWYASRGSFPTDLTAKDAWSTLRAFSEPLDSDTPGRPVAVHRTASSRPTWPAHRYQEPPRDAGPAVPEWPTS
ncbi:MAG: tetratricopeptide repeat protein [Actinomycetota bacterium]